MAVPIETYTLDNGLRVVLSPDTTAPIVAVNLWYHVGSANERAGRTGFAHLFEHMLFQGSAHVGLNEHFELVQRAGGTLNGSTWLDRTNYYETLAPRGVGAVARSRSHGASVAGDDAGEVGHPA
jgi:zinc protease